jgi:hypothetical protein
MRIWAFLGALLLIGVALISAGAHPSAAQTATSTPAPTASGPTNEVEAFFVACADVAVTNFSGQMNANWDIYYQVFSGPNGTGTAISSLRQVAVNGTFAVNERLAYNTGTTVATGATASIRAFVARETDSSNVDFEFTINDLQDGCTNANTTQPGTPVTSVDAGSGSAGTTTTGAISGVTTSILAPNGGTLNPNLSAEPDVVIGARTSDAFRSQTPGLIFAECDAYPLALPGIIYDTDQVTVFWSWFTKTLEQMQQHIDSAVHRVTLNTATLQPVTRSEPVLRNGNYWVFYTANVGNLSPGHYEVGFNLTWSQPHFDGYDDYGPETANPSQSGLCNFDVRLNTSGVSIPHNGMYFPTNSPVHDIAPND